MTGSEHVYLVAQSSLTLLSAAIHSLIGVPYPFDTVTGDSCTTDQHGGLEVAPYGAEPLFAVAALLRKKLGDDKAPVWAWVRQVEATDVKWLAACVDEQGTLYRDGSGNYKAVLCCTKDGVLSGLDTAAPMMLGV